jgi:hypothetical protein
MEYRKVLRLQEKDKVRDTFYSEDTGFGRCL